MARLQGVRAIVTGSGSGIGRAVVTRFLAEGAQVLAVVRKAADAEGLVALGATPLIGDVSKYETADRAVREAQARFGGLDVYVANAGLWDFHRRMEKQSPEELEQGFQEVFGVNVLGALYAARAAVDALRASGGSIIVTGSNACVLGGGGGVLYTASKFALRGLVMQLANELAPLIRVNGVAPGATNTSLSGPSALGQAGKELNADSDRMAVMSEHMLMGRVSEPEDHTSLYVLLAAKQESPYVTGAMLMSDGGLTISI